MTTKFWLLTALLANAFLVKAQPPQKDGNESGLNQEIITVGNRNIRLRDAYKITSQPQIFDTVITKTKVEYNIQPVAVKTRYEVVPIVAANLRIVEPLGKLYRGYVKGGIGMYTSPLGELYFNSIRSRSGGFGLHLKHFSSAGQIKEAIGNSAFSDNKAQLWGKAFIKRHTLAGEFIFTRNQLGLYGIDPNQELKFNPQAELNKNDANFNKQRYNYLGGNAAFESYYDDLNKLNHKLSFAYYNYKDLQGAKEQNFKGGVELSKKYNKELYNLKIQLDNNQYTSDTLFDGSLINPTQLSYKANNSILSFTPQITSIGDKYKLKIGVAVYSELDTSGNQFYVFPDAEFSYNLVDRVLMPYAGLNGDITRNSMYSSSKVNPFVLSALQLKNSVNLINLYGGLRGNISNNMAFNVVGTFTKRKNMQFFINNSTFTQGYNNQFEAIYDEVGIANIAGELSYHRNERLQFTARADYFSYTLDSLPKAWNNPVAKLSLSTRYNLRDKLYLTADFYLESNRFAYTLKDNMDGTFSPDQVNIGKIVDLNLGVEYRYTKRVSAFLNMNNLASNSYKRYNLYPVQAINLLGGITVSF